MKIIGSNIAGIRLFLTLGKYVAYNHHRDEYDKAVSSDEVPLDVLDPAPEQLDPVELFQLEKAAQIFFFLVVSHALRDE